MKITRTVEIQAPAEAVWEIVGTRFADIGVWATRIRSSRAIDSSPGGSLPGRVCAVALPGVDAVEEALLTRDDAAMTLEYRGSGLPSFVADARNRWTVERVGSASRIVVEGRLALTGWTRVLALPLRVALAREGERTLGDLRHFAEHGEPRLHKRAPHWRRPRLEIVDTRRMRAPASAVWALVSDQEAYGAVAPSLAATTILDGAGEGMRRRCELPRGGAWEETCIGWNEGSDYELEVDTATYPMPLRQTLRAVRGRWAVRPADAAHAYVTMRLALGLTLLAWPLKPYMRRRLTRETTAILDAWERQAATLGAPA
jgi:ribosome-associated toxin RatA of RatAB toxin-antitoxin module